MIHRKKGLSSILFIYFLTTLCLAKIHANDFIDHDLQFIDGFDELAFLDDDPFLNDFLDCGDASDITRNTCEAEDIIDIITNPRLGILTILEQNLFLRSNITNQRSLLDYPTYEPFCCYQHKWVVGGHLFYNHMHRSHFTKDSTNLCSYIALSQPSLLDAIQNTINQLKDLFSDDQFNLDVGMLFGLFNTMTVQQRRAGIMFNAQRSTKKSNFRLLTPFYWLERNFFLTDEERAAVEAEFGVLGEEEQEEFQKAHFVSDKLGFGDTRLEWDRKFRPHKRFSFRFGLQATIPTALRVVKEIKGTNFPRPRDYPPPLDFCCLFELVNEFMNAEGDPEKQKEIQEEGFNIITCTMLQALDRVAANLLDVPLGNNGHVGIGFYLRTRLKLRKILPKRKWAQNLTWNGRVSLEYLFPNRERRFFFQNVDRSIFAARDFQDESKAEENLCFLGSEVVQRINLVAFNTLIQPGVIFRWLGKLCYTGKCGIVYFGTDWWIQSKEHFKDIRFDKNGEFAIKKAIPPVAWQSKVHFGFGGRIAREDKDIFITLNGAGTWANSGIGQDFTVSIGAEGNF